VSEHVSTPQPDGVVERIEKSMAWYHHQARWSRLGFAVSKVLTIFIAAAIPMLSGFGPQLLGSAEAATLVVGIFGAVIVVIEGILRTFQWEQHWLRYRSTWLALDREKALYSASAGPYGAAANRRRLLVERTEDLMSRENQTWSSLHEEQQRRTSTDT
jgi:hypothetical protein